MRYLVPALLLSVSAPALAADLSVVDRTILKEPAYKGKPKYCLMAFGPEAKTRVWLVLDDENLYVDRNGDGELTADECFPHHGRGLKPFEITDPSSKGRYNVLGIGVRRNEQYKQVAVVADVEVVGKY